MLLQVEGLKKRFGRRNAVNGVSFTLEVGDVLGFVGPNGAGKTTTMRMIAGYLEPDYGFTRVLNFDMFRQTRDAQQHLGYLPEGAPLYGEMTPWAYLIYVAEARGLEGKYARYAATKAADKGRLGAAIDQTIDTLSKGYRRRVAFAAALIHDPSVLVLDEPTDGLDPNQKRAVRALIADLSKEKAVLISTHALEEVEAMCNRAIIIDRGVIVAQGAPAALAARAASGRLDDYFRDVTKAEDLP
jgi:ABC-2 type transport system ATP-binding protein